MEDEAEWVTADERTVKWDAEQTEYLKRKLASVQPVAVERARWLRALCPHCSPDHVLDNGRVWGFCGAQRVIDKRIAEAEIREAILRLQPKG